MADKENFGFDIKMFGIREVKQVTSRTKIDISKIQEIEKKLKQQFKNGVIEISKVEEFKQEIGYVGRLTNLANWINRRNNDGELSIRARTMAGKLYIIL